MHSPNTASTGISFRLLLVSSFPDYRLLYSRNFKEQLHRFIQQWAPLPSAELNSKDWIPPPTCPCSDLWRNMNVFPPSTWDNHQLFFSATGQDTIYTVSFTSHFLFRITLIDHFYCSAEEKKIFFCGIDVFTLSYYSHCSHSSSWHDYAPVESINLHTFFLFHPNHNNHGCWWRLPFPSTSWYEGAITENLTGWPFHRHWHRTIFSPTKKLQIG